VEWLRQPLICNDAIVRGPLDPHQLDDADLWEICLGMHVILQTIEMPRCEGRLIPCHLFQDMDTLESMIHGHRSPYGHSYPPRLAERTGVIHEFGVYYSLANPGPIAVDPDASRTILARFRSTQVGRRLRGK
jgi:hypothetical protein